MNVGEDMLRKLMESRDKGGGNFLTNKDKLRQAGIVLDTIKTIEYV